MALLMGLVSVGIALLVGLLGLATFGLYLRSPIPTRRPPTRRPPTRRPPTRRPPTQRPSTLKPPLQVWYQGPEHDNPDEPEIDIVAVHGLGADVDWAWTCQSNDGLKHVNWLRDPDMLPSIVPKARILVYTYNSAWLTSTSKAVLQRCGEDMMRRLHDFRNRETDRPIIFIGHSLGGIVIEYGLIFARRQQELQYLTKTTVGCVFLSTPFRGSRYMGFFLKTTSVFQSGIVSNLAYDNEELAETMHEFSALVQSTPMPVVCFYELQKTKFGTRFGLPGLFQGLVVPEESATIPGWKRSGLQADHLNMNKFSSPNDSSFIRVSMEIGKMYKNGSVVLRQSKRERDTYNPQFMVPFGRNEHFVGRQAILEQLLKRIPPDANYDTCQRTALEGLGGTGKTQIALEAIYLLRNQDPACSIFWISASDLTSFENSYYDIGRILQIPGSKDIQVDIKPLVKAALSQEKRAGKWLLVIDNADDSDLLFRGPSLAQFLPFSRNGSILFTTRNHQSAVRLGAMTIKVGSMDMQEAHELLSLGVEPGLVKNENDDSTRELLDVLTYLPLAISQASAYLNKNQVTSTQYLQVLHSNDDDMIHLLSEDFGAHGRYNSDHNPVTSTFFISFDQLRRSNKLAAEYLQLISFLNEIDIPYAILPSAGGKAKMMEAVGGLKAFAFIRQRHDDSFDIHRLVQVSVRRWVMINGVWGNTLKVAINRLNDVLPIPEHQTRDAWARYLPHVLSVLNLAREREGEDYPNRSQLMSKTGTWLSKMGKYGGAEAMFQEVLVTQTRDLGAEHPETFLTMNNIGAIFFQEGKFEEATSMLTQVLAMRKKILGDNHPDVLSSMNNLASTLEGTGKLNEAMMLQEEVLEKRRRILGTEHPSTLLAMSNLASTLKRTGKLDEAMILQEEVLNKRRRILGAEHPETLLTMNNIGVIFFQEGKFEEATSMLTQVLAMRKKILGDNHPDVLSSMNNFASTLKRTGKLDEAMMLQEEVLNKRRRILGAEHPSTLSAMSDLASMLENIGRLDEAMMLQEEVLNKRRRILGAEHPSTLSAMSNLAKLWFRQGKIEEAVAISREALKKKRKIFGDDHREVISAMDSHALMLRAQGRVEEAEEMQREAGNRMRRVLGHEHPDTATATPDISSTGAEQSKAEQEVEVRAETYS